MLKVVLLDLAGQWPKDQGPGSSALKLLLEDAAQGKFDVLLCTDLPRLARCLSPEIVTALWNAGVRVVTGDGCEIGVADLVAQAGMRQFAKTPRKPKVILDPFLVFTFSARSCLTL